MTPSILDLLGAGTFGLAILHTFAVKHFQHLARRFPEGSLGENVFHLLGEVELVFGLWAGIYLLGVSLLAGQERALAHLESCNFTEPAFVFAILAVCSTRPILELASGLIGGFARLIPLERPVAFYGAALVLGPLLGSLITEPAAMTVTALLLLERFYQRGISEKLKYATLGLLFVNVSLGGTLTPYAAPPILMVAGKWNWDLSQVFFRFGWKGALAIAASTLGVTLYFRKELSGIDTRPSHRSPTPMRIPVWVSLVHLLFLAGIVVGAHHAAVFLGLFFLFLGLYRATREFQNRIQIREGLMVGFFLAGLVVLGGPQRWWLEPLLRGLSTLPLYLGAIGLTAFTDNAALTYLGAQVPDLSDASRTALVAGAVAGGGLTVIANAPNPAGYGILNGAFGEDGISPGGLFRAALLPTAIAAVCFWFLG